MDSVKCGKVDWRKAGQKELSGNREDEVLGEGVLEAWVMGDWDGLVKRERKTGKKGFDGEESVRERGTRAEMVWGGGSGTRGRRNG